LQASQPNAGTHGQPGFPIVPLPRHGDVGSTLLELDDDRFHLLIGQQEITAASQDKVRDLARSHQLDEAHQGIGGLRTGEAESRAANTKGGVGSQGLVPPAFDLRQIAQQGA